MDVFETVKKIIIEELGCKPEKVVLEARLKEDLSADSIDAVKIIIDLEDTFNIQIDEDNAENIKTVKDVVDYVSGLIK